jgi:c(7)-type cytochrome triheme protein
MLMRRERMKSRMLVLAAAMVFLLAGAALATQPGKTLVFDKSAMGVVTFDGQKHAEAGFKCTDCHKEGLFPQMKKGTTTITMDAMYARKLCGSCHDGTIAFPVKGNCGKCHKK